MTKPLLHFERRSTGVYAYLFHAGPFYWPVPLEAVSALKAHATDSPDGFRTALVAAVSLTPYLNHQLDLVLADLGERDTDLRALQESLATL
jgi:hypothetical protein